MWFLYIMHSGFGKWSLHVIAFHLALFLPLIYTAVDVSRPGPHPGGQWMTILLATLAEILLGNCLGHFLRQVGSSDGRRALLRSLLNPLRFFRLPAWAVTWSLLLLGYEIATVFLLLQLSGARRDFAAGVLAACVLTLTTIRHTTSKTRERTLAKMAKADPYGPDAWMRWPR